MTTVRHPPLPTIIAEVKTRSPFGFCARKSREELLDLAMQTGDWVSIHTEEPWGGSLEWLREAVRRIRASHPLMPIIAKGIHAADSQILAAFDAGATRVLAVGRHPHINNTLYEPNSLEELARTLGESSSPIDVVWNQRSLTGGGHPKTETFEQARDLHIGWLCQASLIRTPQDISPYADAIMVGEHLPAFAAFINEENLLSEASP